MCRFSHEKLYSYKKRCRGKNIRPERAASGVAEDAEIALRARMPEERVMISLFRM
jgi:hypothetical protein